MSRKDIVRATNFRIGKVAKQDCLIAEIRITNTVSLHDQYITNDNITPKYLKRKIQETLDKKTDHSWIIDLSWYNDIVHKAMDGIVKEVEKLNTN